MQNRVIINTSGEEKSHIPDKWVLGTGLSTDALYVVHTGSPFMIVQYPLSVEEGGSDISTVYMTGSQIESDLLKRLFAEAWEIVEIYKERLNMLSTGAGKLLTRRT